MRSVRGLSAIDLICGLQTPIPTRTDMAPKPTRGRPPKRKLQSYDEWKRTRPGGRDKSREAYKAYKVNHAAWRARRLE